MGLMSLTRNIAVTVSLSAILVLASQPAHALRCGNKLVKQGMYEFQVIAICGEPVVTRQLGFVMRSYRHPKDRLGSGVEVYYPGYGFREDLLVTEMFYNFGPHKLMRRLRFEGGRLKRIDTAGYGYLEKE